MIKYNPDVRLKMFGVTPIQVEHVIEFGDIVTEKIETRGGSLRLCTPKRKTSILKKFDFQDELVYVRCKYNRKRIIIIDIIVKIHDKERRDG